MWLRKGSYWIACCLVAVGFMATGHWIAAIVLAVVQAFLPRPWDSPADGIFLPTPGEREQPPEGG